MITALLPALRVVPLEQCVLHEETDPSRVSRLVERLEGENILRNPPILGCPPGYDSCIVLDGSTRVTALRAVGVEHLIAQVIDLSNPAIHLEMWGHLLLHESLERLAGVLQDSSPAAVRFADLQEAEAAFTRREALTYVVDRVGRCLLLSREQDLKAQAATLQRLFRAYAATATIIRVPGNLWRKQFEEEGGDITVIFPRYTTQELADLARAGALLPPGITRHIIPGRVLRINIPLDILRQPGSLEDKQAWLDQWVRERWASQRVRYYEEPTFVFDE